MSMSDWWTNTSADPSSGAMNPKPFVALNHFTVPTVIAFFLSLHRAYAIGEVTNAGRHAGAVRPPLKTLQGTGAPPSIGASGHVRRSLGGPSPGDEFPGAWPETRWAEASSPGPTARREDRSPSAACGRGRCRPR